MNSQLLLSDFLAKGANLVGFLSVEKGETLISQKLFDAITAFCEGLCSLQNPAYSKAEVASLRKSASACCDRISMYLGALLSGGSISVAQKDSMLQSLDTLKKEFNI
ncbi:MAG: hypothetical protein IJ297_01230 [Clostridia bacterium]|nr:hypothetical protein [Clostridia bacterium]